MKAVHQVRFSKTDTDPFFNDRAARAAYELVMKMDDDEARFFTTVVVAEELWDLIEKNQRALQGRLDQVVAKRLDRIMKGIDSTIVKKRMNDEDFDEDLALATAGAAALISKAVRNPYAYGYQYDETDFRRGRDGRFTTKVKPEARQKPMRRSSEKAAGIPKPNVPEGKHMSGEARANYQAQYLQIAAALDRFDDTDDATITVRDGAGRVSERRLMGANGKAAAQAWDPAQEDVVAVSVAPRGLTVGGAGFELVSALGGSPETAALRGGQLEAANTAMPGFSRDWASATSSSMTNSNDRLYGRIEAGSKFVSQVAPTGSKAQVAAKFGEFVGARGPEAEQVIGPTARKTAYRYRGVSREPDHDLKHDFERRMRSEGKNVTPDQHKAVSVAQARAIKQATIKEAESLGKPVEAIRLSNEQRAAVMNDAKRGVLGGGDFVRVSPETQSIARREVGDKLARKGPKGGLYELQLASGHLPPSEGVIVDAKGRMVAQAVGYADDHYLPFNLKQLGALKGGEYIRTRSVGGPTSEDIYTGLVSGANAITVASRSGTFEIVFKDDFKGGRRYNDKPKRMIDRYEKLLDAVQSGEVRRAEQVDPAIKRQIEDQLIEEDPDYKFYSPKDRRDVLRGAIEAYRKDPDWTDADEAAVASISETFLKQNPDRDDDAGRAWIESRVRNKIKADKELNYQLNGRGYEAALEALQEQFPYYIESVRRYDRQADDQLGTSQRDKGYVKPRHNRPAAARASYFDTSITGDGKVMADQVDYQNRNGQRTRAPQEAKAEQVTAPDEESERRTAAANAAKENLKGERQKEGRRTLSDTAAKILGGIHGTYGAQGERVTGEGADAVKAQIRAIGTPDELADDIRRHGTGGPRYQEFDDFVDRNKESLFIEGGIEDGPFLGTQWDAARGLVGAMAFNKDEPFVVGEAPSTFEGDAYNEVTATARNVPAEMRKHDQISILDSAVSISDLSEPELVEQIKALGKLDDVLKVARRAQDAETDQKAKTAAFNRALSNADIDFDVTSRNNPTVWKALKDPAAIPALAENVHRMRALQRIRDKGGFPSPREQSEGDEARAKINQEQAMVASGDAKDWATSSLEYARKLLASAKGSDAEGDIRDAVTILERVKDDGLPEDEFEAARDEVLSLLGPHYAHLDRP